MIYIEKIEEHSKMPVLKLFKTLTPDKFSASTYSAIVNELDTSTWLPLDLTGFCLDQIEFFAESDDTDNLLLWSVFLAYCKQNSATGFTRTDEEGDDLVAIVFTDETTDADGTVKITRQALVFDQEKTSVTPPDQGEVDVITDLIRSALGG